MSDLEYLVSYGVGGEFGRFRSARPLECARGDRVVVRTHRGVEAGNVLRPAAAGHARFLPNTTVGQLLRPFGGEDAQAEQRWRDRGSAVWKRAAELAGEMGLPFEVLDVEVLLDGEHVVLHHLRGGECDVRPFVSTLTREFGLHVLLVDLSQQANPALNDEQEQSGHGCSSCGSDGGCGSGGCGSCGSGGCGSCSTAPTAPSSRFTELRELMERQRTSLL
jgi:hypothetical protein